MADDLAPKRVWEAMQNDGAVLIDLRLPSDFAPAHPKNAINLPYSSKSLAERIESVLPSQAEQVIFLAANAAEGEAALERVQDSAFSVSGMVAGGINAWQAAGLPTTAMGEHSLDELTALEPSNSIVILDVREPMEWEIGHVPGAMLISLGQLRQEMHRLPQQAHIAVICESGIRSSIAASILLAAGFEDVANVVDGTRGYRQAGLPLTYWQAEE